MDYTNNKNSIARATVNCLLCPLWKQHLRVRRTCPDCDGPYCWHHMATHLCAHVGRREIRLTKRELALIMEEESNNGIREIISENGRERKAP